MTLDIVIIPKTKSIEEYAHEVYNYLKKELSCDIIIDKEYNNSLIQRKNNAKYDANIFLFLGANELKNKTLQMRLTDNYGDRNINIDEFIELVKSFDYALQNNEYKEEPEKLHDIPTTVENKEEKEEETGGCLIM